MSGLYLYAIVRPGPAGALGAGLAAEPLATVDAGGVVAVVGEMAEAPGVTPDAMRGHDAIVKRLAAVVDAILPARFGTLHETAALGEWLAASASRLDEALRLVAGREQMTLHVFDGPDPVTVKDETRADESGLGPGARYLAERRRHWRERERLPELAALRPRLDALVAAERVELRTTPPLRASVYHLIERGRSAEYRGVVEAGAPLVAGARLRVSGPWAPYAFAVSA